MLALRAAAILALFLMMTLPLMPLQGLLVALGSPLARRLPCWYHRQVCRLIGMRLHVEGEIASGRPVLIVANHVSWLDIPVMSAIAPVSFIAKREVGTWPFIGWLARLQRCVFVDRDRRTAAGEQRNEIARRLAAGDHMILFPEGTTGDGNRVLPFKSALLAAAGLDGEVSNGGAAIQTLAIAYTRIHGMPIGRALRPVIAWYGDMDVPGHAWQVLKSGPVDVRIKLSAPMPLEQLTDRKALARAAEAAVKRDFASLLRR
jgi:1-acyl-sn-glycerol-3-phosphate acyltransferase